MRILIFSDIHLHNHVYGATTVDYPEWGLKGYNSRLVDGAKAFEQIAKYIEEHPVDEVVFCGDLFHTHGKLDANVLRVAYQGWERLVQAHFGERWHLWAMVGNHDTSDKTLNTHDMHWLHALGVNVIDQPEHAAAQNKMSLLPYTEDVDVIQQFLTVAAAKKTDTICFLHAGVDGVPMKSGFVPGSAFNTDMIPDGVGHVFSGHYHPHQKVTDKATVIGSTMQLNWADEGDRRGFLVYDTDTGKIEQIETAAPKFVTIDMGDGSCGWARGTEFQLNKNNFIRVKNHEEWDMEELRKQIMGAGARSVEFVVKEKEVDRLQPLSNDELHIPDIIKEYEAQKAVTPERSKIGEELRK